MKRIVNLQSTDTWQFSTSTWSTLYAKSGTYNIGPYLMTIGLLLFAHGSRDPSWSEPFQKLLQRVRARSSERPCELAYLEAAPDLREGAIALCANGASAIEVIPLFLSRGTHLRQDLPALVEAVSSELGVPISVRAAIGEDERMLDALAGWITT